MLRMFARRSGQAVIPAGQDKVLFGISLPGDSVINNIRAKIHCHESSAGLAAFQSVRYAVEGWILPVLDPDSATTFDNIWDALVPKDTDVLTLDLDTVAGDGTPFFEPGEVDWSDVFDVGLRPERIYHRQRLLSFVNGASFKFQDNQTPFAMRWSAGDYFEINIARRLAVRQPSVLVFGFAAPALDDTTTTLEAALAEAEWAQVKYMEHVLERAMLHVLGVVESGAETPWEEATALIQKHLDPDVREDTAGRFSGGQWEALFEMMVDHSVVGTLEKQQVSTGR